MNRILPLLALVVVACTRQPDGPVTEAPQLGEAPVLTLPTVDTARLDNGLTILTSRNAEVPMVSARLIIDGGARTAGAAPGLATFTAGMLDEGAAGKTGLELSEAVDFLGASLNTGAGWENVTISTSAPKRTFEQAMGLMADVVLRPTFASADVARERAAREAALLSAKDSPGQVANRVFYRNVYPAGHPYHVDMSGDVASTARLDSAAVRGFWTAASDPRHATLIVTGDVTAAEAKSWAQSAFGAWQAPSSEATKTPAADVAAAPSSATRIILVDKPGAAQSVIYIGAPGVARNTPDYAAIEVMNTILGGSFSSRLNDILREQRGYSYGAGSNFNWNPVAGPFTASSQVRTDVTDSSLAVFFHEFNRIRDEPVDTVELMRARNYLVLGALGDYETAGQVGGAISSALLFGMPLQQTADDLAAMGKVTAADVQRVAKQYLDPSKLTVVVVGDLSVIRPGIEALGLGPIEVQTY
ncbi:MAG TPA: pitrilysin family protein [Gemmatimonadales bacterium]|nr:pitrilysin family protein [Gemmatimonadales bacterium]